MRSLVVAENLPYPTLKGGDLRNWQNIVALGRLGEVGVFGLCSNDRRTAKPRTDVALWRTSSDPELAIPSPATRVAACRRWLLEADAHPSDSYSTGAASELERVIDEFRPDVVVVERLWLHRYIAHIRKFPCRIVFDGHNVEADLSRQLARAERGDAVTSRAIRRELAIRTETIERRALQDVDQVWVCSDNDRRSLERAYAPRPAVHVVANGVDVSSYADDSDGTPACRDAGEAARYVFPGVFSYAPNAGAAQFLIDELMPRLLEVSRARLVLVGTAPTAPMLDAARRDNRIVVTGTVPDVRPFLRTATAIVVPLFEGSGTRFKILEAFASRVPVVTTRIGADGLDVEDGVHLLFAESVGEFVAALERLQSERALGGRLTARAYELVTRRYSWDAAYMQIAAAIDALQAEVAVS